MVPHMKKKGKLRLSDIHFHDFQLLIFDIDGTLLSSSHQLDSFTKEMLVCLEERGKQYTLATGKILPATKPLADELEIDLPLILSNGAIVGDRFGKVLEQTRLPLPVTESVIQVCEKRGEDLVIYVCDKILIKEMNENIYPIYDNVAEGLIEVHDWGLVGGRLGDANKCLVVDRFNQQNLFDLEKIFWDEVGDRADVLHTSTQLLEVVPQNITKATGLEVLSKILNIPVERMMAFGDYDNDVTMLRRAGLGIAVANASEAALESADLIIGSLEENGVAEFLSKWLD